MKLKKLDLANEKDVRFVYDVRCHPDVDKWLFGLRPANYKRHKEHLEKTKEKVFIMYDKVPIGYCNYKIGAAEVEVGWKIHPDYQNKGYGTESVGLLINRIRSKKNIVLYVTKNNNRAVHLYRKMGFHLVFDDGEVYKMEKL